MVEGLVSRRALLRSTAYGLAGVALGSGSLGTLLRAVGAASSSASAGTLELTIRECLVEMVDETRVYAWAFDSPEAGLRVPGPVIQATDGTGVSIRVTNAHHRPHAFAIPGVVDSGPIPPGESRLLEFTAPPAGTYLYLDPLRAPINRVMGLGGVFVSQPAGPAPTPYTHPTTQVRNLFDDLGDSVSFPGDPWRPERTWIWVFTCVDPVQHDRLADEPDLAPVAFAAEYLPRYFLLNGRSGFFSTHDPGTAPTGRVGQPALIRTANLGMATHSPHIHGNHVYQLSEGGRVAENVYSLDTWRLPPLETRDVLLPFVRPPDAYPWPPSDPKVWTTDLAGDGTKGMVFPMHCHAELSQLANGGNYPQGLLTHWVLTGDLEVAG